MMQCSTSVIDSNVLDKSKTVSVGLRRQSRAQGIGLAYMILI